MAWGWWEPHGVHGGALEHAFFSWSGCHDQILFPKDKNTRQVSIISREQMIEIIELNYV